MISRKTLRFIAPVAAVTVCLVAIGCSGGSDAGGPVPTADNAAPTTSTAALGTFASVTEFAQKRCMPCHSTENRKGRLDMTSHESIISRVKAGDPDNSEIIQFLRGTKTPQMPKNGPFLTEDEMKVFIEWIKAGAPA